MLGSLSSFVLLSGAGTDVDPDAEAGADADVDVDAWIDVGTTSILNNTQQLTFCFFISIFLQVIKVVIPERCI